MTRGSMAPVARGESPATAAARGSAPCGRPPIALLVTICCLALACGTPGPEASKGFSQDLLCPLLEQQQEPPGLPETLLTVQRDCGCGGPQRCFYWGRLDRRRAAWLPPGTSLSIPLSEAAGAHWLRFSVRAAGDADAAPPSLGLTLEGTDGSLEWAEPVESLKVWQDIGLDIRHLGEPQHLTVTVNGDGQQVIFAMPRLVAPNAGPDRNGASNVLVYLIDTLRPDHMSIYGYDRQTTPFIDSLFGDQAVFTHAYSTAPWTRPATGSLLTSLYPSFHGATARQSLADDILTLAERLRRAGWSTWAFVGNGNVHGNGLNFEQGFDRFIASRGVNNDNHPLSNEIHDQVLPHLEAFGDEPFFLYVHTVDPHTPYDPPPGFRGKMTDPAYGGSITSENAKKKLLRKMELADDDVAYIKGLYDEDILYQDSTLQDFFTSLEGLGLTDGLLTVLTSDHGEEFYEHKDWEHGKRLYEEQIRIPLMIRGSLPGLQNQRIGMPVQIIDIMPTLLDWLGVDDKEGLQGMSLAPLLAGTEPELEDRPIYCEEIRADWDRDLFCFRRGDSKVILRAFHPPKTRRDMKLFELDLDPLEAQDRSKEDRRRFHALRDELRAFQSTLETNFEKPTEIGSPELDEETKQQLRALGYLGGG